MRRALSTTLGLLWVAAGILALAYVAWYDLSTRTTDLDVPVQPARPAGDPSASDTPAATGQLPEDVASCGRLRIGWTAWADAELVTRLAAHLLRGLGCDVQLVMTDIGLQYRGLAEGELDLMLMAWLPTTHAAYYNKVAESVANLGPVYTGAQLGWAVPDYVPASELSSLEDLHHPDVRARLKGRIQGIDPGSGLMQASEQVLEAYGLTDYRLLAGSGAAMTAAVERAYRLERWVVVTTWSPHWMFSRWQLRYLEDPRRVLSQNERVHALARRDFGRDFPKAVVDLITRMYLPLDELQDALAYAVERSMPEAVDRYVAQHPSRVEYWRTGSL